MANDYAPAYRRLLTEAQLAARASAARARLEECALCPRACHVNRLAGEKGACKTGAEAVVSSFGPHFGEEAPLVGRGGSGTIFLTNCNLACLFCQNYDISHLGRGEETPVARLAEMMLSLQRDGCHNINWVTPTHQVPALLEALAEAAARGLHVPVVYNCGGYESVETLRLLDGIVDIYMPDAKYGDNAAGRRLSGVPDYWDRNREALREMHRQVGDLQIDESGLARRGLLVRHLVLPNDAAHSRPVFDFLAALSQNSYLNVMAQYRPCYRAQECQEVNRPPARKEYLRAVLWAQEAGLTRPGERVSIL